MTAPDLTAMLRDTLAAHADCTMNQEYDDAGAAITAEDHWSCGITFPYDENQTLEDVERAHQAAVLAATVRNWLGSAEVREALIFDIAVMENALVQPLCCEGGAGMGYHRAGFDVTGVDIEARGHRYINYVKDHGHEFDAIHASPPCQAYSITKHSHNAEHPDLLEPTREALQATGLPYIIENVPGAPLINPITLCGAAFGLTATDTDGTRLVLKRHRLFESNTFLRGAE